MPTGKSDQLMVVSAFGSGNCGICQQVDYCFGDYVQIPEHEFNLKEIDNVRFFINVEPQIKTY